ncbi:MAG: hypothetical protein JXA77_09605 [Bacteroidales bacterium]|nr:hypothetical protein [Bacteroidales bacterium]MBN2817425.1 hypothetical protein [Bacteroidales bacterium]
MINCTRCKKLIDEGFLCQSCKSELVPFYEKTNDWQIAYDLEFAQKSFSKYKANYDSPDFYSFE